MGNQNYRPKAVFVLCGIFLSARQYLTQNIACKCHIDQRYVLRLAISDWGNSFPPQTVHYVKCIFRTVDQLRCFAKFFLKKSFRFFIKSFSAEFFAAYQSIDFFRMVEIKTIISHYVTLFLYFYITIVT